MPAELWSASLKPIISIRSVDEVHMMNAVCNLIDNAIKYSGGKPEILVYTQEKTGAYLIGVQDHGIGISKEAQKKVFKRFLPCPEWKFT